MHVGRAPGGLEQRGCPLVVGGDDVDGDVALEHRVASAPEPPAPALREQVHESITTGEHVARPDRVRHYVVVLPFVVR